ncbi:MAG: sugar porter family MFS transporter [Deltaproteobacteria bacterium]|nr:sugar porter family MFS transporter [Deltaproteobacteria bacterium]
MKVFQSVYFVSGLAAIAGLLFGYDTGVISGAILFIRQDFGLPPGEIGLIVSAVLIGALVGSAFCSQITDRIGRKGSLLIAAILYVLSSTSSALSQGVVELIASRFFLGIAIGISSLTAPLYLAEIAPAKLRGLLVSLNQLAITIGILSAYGIAYALSADQAWRWMLGIGVIPAAILGIALLMLPESPRWMMLKGKVDQARKILSKLRSGADIEPEIKEIEHSLSHEKANWKSLFSKPVRPALVIAMGLACFQQTTGINTIIYYAPTIFEKAGFGTASHAILATVSVGIINVLFTIISLPLLDRIGRRPLLIFGMTGMFLSLAIWGLAFQVGNLEAFRWVALACMLVYVACFAISLGPIMWLMVSEVFPLKLRGIGTSISICAQWGFNFLVSGTFPSLLHAIGPSYTFWLYAVLCLAGIIFVIKKVPETKGLSLEKIQF